LNLNLGRRSESTDEFRERDVSSRVFEEELRFESELRGTKRRSRVGRTIVS